MVAHSGKLLSTIQQDIEDKKQKIEFLSGPKNVLKFKERKRIKTLDG